LFLLEPCEIPAPLAFLPTFHCVFSFFLALVTVVASLIPSIKYQGRMVVPLTEIYVRYTDGIAQAFVIIAAIVAACVVGISITIFVLHRKGHLVIKYASPPFLYTINFGAIMLCVAIWIMGGTKPGLGNCDAALWLTALGVNAMYAAVLAKAGRLWYILKRAAKLQKVTLPNKVLFLAFLIQSFTVLIVLILGTALQPFETISVADPRLPVNNVYIYCRPRGGSLWPIALVIYQGALAAVGLFFAFKTRHLFDELNESREITMITYNMLFVGIVIILLLYLTGGAPAALYAIEVVGISWFVIVTLIILYFPKVYFIVTGNSMHSNSQSTAMMGRTGTRGPNGSGVNTKSSVRNISNSQQQNGSGSVHITSEGSSTGSSGPKNNSTGSKKK
jgi:hypothetical protein